MKLHTICFTAVAFLLLKVFVGTNTAEVTVGLSAAALGAFLVGCFAHSFAYDKERGETSTRDAFILFGIWHLSTGFGTICAIIIAGLIYLFKG